MSDLRKAAEMALEALEHAAECVQTNYLPDKCGHDWDEQIEALRQALAQPEQEPVAWMNKKSAFMCGKTDESGVAFHIITTSKQTKHHTVPLYTAPSNLEAAVLAEREACAKVCEDNAKEWIDGNNDWCQGQATGSIDCAAAIRARGEK